jgi:demethylmenaquinone methyltransferase/2-methoxy-6-polyprenyl-1,4-benzoquinol methylase
MENTPPVAQLFARIASRYDRMNRLMTLGLDLQWRKVGVRRLRPLQPRRLLDLAAGTGDFARMATLHLPSLKEVYLVDITAEMLAYAPAKKPRQAAAQWHTQVADAHALPFPDGYFDAITVGYGVRNFADRIVALGEMYRVLRPGGQVVILETGLPRKVLWKALFWMYFRFIVPVIGGVIARDKAAYTYLPESTAAFPHREAFLYLCREAGFSSASYTEFMGGASILYQLYKDA